MATRLTRFGRLATHAAARCVSAFVLLALCTTASVSEVCDKVAGDAWMPEHGPQILVGLTWPGSFVVILLCALAIWSHAIPAGVVIGIGVIATLFGVISVIDLIDDHTVIRGSLHEGCRAVWADLTNLGFGFAMLWVGWRMRRRRAVSALHHARFDY